MLGAEQILDLLRAGEQPVNDLVAQLEVLSQRAHYTVRDRRLTRTEGA